MVRIRVSIVEEDFVRWSDGDLAKEPNPKVTSWKDRTGSKCGTIAKAFKGDVERGKGQILGKLKLRDGRRMRTGNVHPGNFDSGSFTRLFS